MIHLDSIVLRCFEALKSSTFRRYAQVTQAGVKPRDDSQKELEPLKLPGKLAQYTGNVLYPNEDSAVWDVNGKIFSN